MSKEDHRIGITPIVIRRAAYYLTLGVGEYYPNHPHFDRVTVERLYDITPNSDNDMEWSMGMVVSFWQGPHKTRWIEFGCKTTGAGGDSILKVTANGEDCKDTEEIPR